MNGNERMQVSAAKHPEHVLAPRDTHQSDILFALPLITSFAEGWVFSSVHIIQKMIFPAENVNIRSRRIPFELKHANP